MANKEASLNEIKLKTVTELLGMNFYIPEYQRGYRWTQTNVNQLLAEIFGIIVRKLRTITLFIAYNRWWCVKSNGWILIIKL
jgi:uncharacterized protein with ParB-like and HNH nuclease domain